MTIVETRLITGGVDTYVDVHVAAALDSNGGTLGVESFPTTTTGFAELHPGCLASARCMTRWANSAGRGFEDMASRFGFDAAYEEHERGTLDVAGYFEALRRGLSVDLADDELLEGWNDIYVGVNEEICPVLAAARARFPLYALTNSNPSHHAVWSERFADVLEVFTATLVSSDIGHRKPIGRHSTPSPR